LGRSATKKEWVYLTSGVKRLKWSFTSDIVTSHLKFKYTEKLG